MGIKQLLQNNNFFVRGYYYIRRFLTKISPKLNTQVTYFIAKGKPINLKEPKTFEEKLLWLKLNTYANHPLVTQGADKYLVRDYVKEKGYGRLLNDLYFVWDSASEINWGELPQKFAIKCNHGSGLNIISDNKNEIDFEESERKLNEWMKYDQWKGYAEVNYRNIEKKIICEKYLKTNQGFFPNDYKIYCFNGKPQAILVINDRDDETKAVFMSPDWEYISVPSKYDKPKILPEKPKSLNEMLEASESLSGPFPFVRADFYQYDDKPIFGELTFTPAGGLYVSKTDINGVSMGDLLDISEEMESIKNIQLR